MTTTHSQYSFAAGLNYPAIVNASERVEWTVEEIFGDHRFDATKAIVPESWVQTRELDFLSEAEQLELNHCRAFSYVHLLGNFEEFVPLHLTGVVERSGHADRAQLRALLRFGEEELKHQQLFRRAEIGLEDACGRSFGRYFDDGKIAVTNLSNALLAHPPLARFLVILALEWGTQRHYVESVRDRNAARADALYADILKAHWREEAQHTKCDMLEIVRLAATTTPEERRAEFDHLAAIGGLVDESFIGQAALEIETLERATGRTLSEAQRAVLQKALHRSLSAIFLTGGLSHPTFVCVAASLSPEGAAKLGIG
jgi:hypothetical protein